MQIIHYGFPYNANTLVYVLQSIANFYILLFLFQSTEKLIQCGNCVYIKLMMKISPAQVNPSFESNDIQQPDTGYLMVLIQISIWNVQEVSNFCDL